MFHSECWDGLKHPLQPRMIFDGSEDEHAGTLLEGQTPLKDDAVTTDLMIANKILEWNYHVFKDWILGIFVHRMIPLKMTDIHDELYLVMAMVE
ncbi:hypothetical protein AMEX_G2935 [Astyanax mexicanus]|uniref:Uncharacterized protein n=1 Tax=Astyanax mexicanus TaxID=7994 RepID=A0A8T2M7B7_ASTMX|nr:hypothetical protein AMEX_G2935 [Astyanax mexicanus]